jgi:acyl-CoA dehydrogenase
MVGRVARPDSIYPATFASCGTPATEPYLGEFAIRKLVEFFEAKGLAALKDEDRREEWYADWIAYQAANHLYASMLSPKGYSTMGFQLDLLKLARFLEVFGHFSPAHGYSFQVTLLGMFAILMGSNSALKREAVAALEAGKVLGFGVSEKEHGADLFGNEFVVKEVSPGRFVACGRKYYIGNSNCASIIAILARKEQGESARVRERAPFVLFALRPQTAPGFRNIQKIRTLGVRAGYVGEFEVLDHELAEEDVIAAGRDAWDAVFGAITLGKFFLGFGSVGICERAYGEAVSHLSRRILFSKPVINMPHIRSTVAQAYARLTAMKLYAYRALDYVQGSSADDRRYILFNAVQKAKVGTEGVKVMSLLSECMGAKGFEADTYFEMALRDAQLIPALEGSTHINLRLASQFIPRYFSKPEPGVTAPGSLLAGETAAAENPYLMEARTGTIHTIGFPRFLDAYAPLMSVANVRSFARQAKAFQLAIRAVQTNRAIFEDTQTIMAFGQCFASIAYGQLIAEHAARMSVSSQIVAVIFHMLVNDLSIAALSLAALPGMDAAWRSLFRRMITVPTTSTAEWEFVSTKAVGNWIPDTKARTNGHARPMEGG